MEPGDVLLVHTDGLTEASADNGRFGGDAVQSVLANNAAKDAQTVVDHLYDALMKLGHGKVSDDVAIVAIKVL